MYHDTLEAKYLSKQKVPPGESMTKKAKMELPVSKDMETNQVYKYLYCQFKSADILRSSISNYLIWCNT